jgi:hypothetical protein
MIDFLHSGTSCLDYNLELPVAINITDFVKYLGLFTSED